MKEQFAQLMLEKDFTGAAELIFAASLNVKAPYNTKLNINIDKEQNILDIASKMESVYTQINQAYSEISFDGIFNKIVTDREFSNEDLAKVNDTVLDKMKAEFDKALIRFHSQQYEQIFDATTVTSNAALQGLINAAAQL